MKLSSLDWVILTIPVLGVLDVLSTFFVALQGYPIHIYEAGLFASYFAQAGLLPFYVPFYLGILSGATAVLLFIKRELTTSKFHDELFFMLLVFAICLVEAVLTNVVVSNFLIGLSRFTSLGGLRWLIYLSVFVSILTFTWDELKEQLGFGKNGKD